jgi:hypothetical protein
MRRLAAALHSFGMQALISEKTDVAHSGINATLLRL